MTQSSIISFGLAAMAASKCAKCGEVTWRDQVALARKALDTDPEAEDLRHAVADFLGDIPIDPVGAGVRLQSFLDEWLDQVCPRASEQIAAGMDADTLFAWQERADLK